MSQQIHFQASWKNSNDNSMDAINRSAKNISLGITNSKKEEQLTITLVNQELGSSELLLNESIQLVFQLLNALHMITVMYVRSLLRASLFIQSTDGTPDLFNC